MLTEVVILIPWSETTRLKDLLVVCNKLAGAINCVAIEASGSFVAPSAPLGLQLLTIEIKRKI
jgi:hypothetical protein